MTDAVDVVVVGGGHNGLVAAGYLAGAGLTVRVLERLDVIGGAAVSAQAFDGVDARLSRYAYLVSLLPRRIVEDLGASVHLARRRYASYTPDPADGGRSGLLVGETSTFAAVGAAADERGFTEFYRRCRTVTEALWPTLLEPLRTRTAARRLVLDGGAADAAAAVQKLSLGGGGGGAAAAAPAPAEPAAEEPPSIEKQIRNLKKKMRQAEALAEKRAGGTALTAEEEAKLAKLPGWQGELAALEAQL